MDSCKRLSVWATIGLLIASVIVPTSVSANEQDTSDGGARRPEKPMEEVVVVGSRDETKMISFNSGFSDIILVHEYDREDNEWKLVGLRDIRRGTTKAITH